MLTKANRRSTVHRPTYLDYVGVRRFDENGEVDRRTPLPRAVHVVGVQLEPDRRAAAAPQGRGSGRTGRIPPGQSRPEGPDRDPRDLSARRSLPDQRRVALRERDGDPAAAGTPARTHLPEPRDVRPLRLVHRVPPARSLHDTGAHADRRDPHRRVPGAEPRVERAPRRVGARPPALRAARRSAPSAAFRHRRAGSGSRGGDARVGRRLPRLAHGDARRRGRARPAARLGRRVPCGLPRRLRRGRDDGGPRRCCSRSKRKVRSRCASPSRRAVRRPQALRRGHAAVALRRAAEPHQHGRHRRRRAPVRHTTPRAAAPVDQALPAARPAARDRDRRGRRPVRGRVPRGAVGRGRRRRLQPARPPRRALVARGDAARARTAATCARSARCTARPTCRRRSPRTPTSPARSSSCS